MSRVDARTRCVSSLVVTPEQFGATGFNSVADLATAVSASTAAQEAVDYLASMGGGTLYLSANGYLWNTAVTVPDGVEVIGTGGKGNVGGGLDPSEASPMAIKGTVLYSSSYSNFSFFIVHDNARIAGISFDSVGASPTVSAGQIFDLSNAHGSAISDCFVNRAYHGIYIANTTHGQGTVNSITIDRVHMTNVWGHRCYLVDVCGVWVSDCAWFNAAIYSTSNGITMVGACASVFFSNVSVYQAYWGAELTCLSGAAQLNDIHISNCEFDRLGSGIYGGGVRCNGWVTNVHLDHCWMATGTQGVRLQGTTTHPCGAVSIIGCTIINNVYAGIVISGTYNDGHTIIGNNVNGNNTADVDGYGAIKVENAPTNIRVVGNDLSNTASFFHVTNNGHQRYGVLLENAEASDYIVIMGNVVTRGNTTGITNNSTGTHNYIDANSNI